MSLGHKLRNLCACVPQLLQKVEIKIKHILVMFIKKKKSKNMLSIKCYLVLSVLCCRKPNNPINAT